MFVQHALVKGNVILHWITGDSINFDIIEQLLATHSTFVRYWRRNDITMG
jgi:hypothetical protein